MAARVYSRATAGNARRFLLDGSPPCRSRCCPSNALLAAHVDQPASRSEFMAEFEDACEELGVPPGPLAVGRVLPPRRPQWNGRVERANRSARIEFWNRYQGPLTVASTADALAGYEFFFNYQRPHQALDYRAPTSTLWRSRLPDQKFRKVLNQHTALTSAAGRHTVGGTTG